MVRLIRWMLRKKTRFSTPPIKNRLIRILSPVRGIFTFGGKMYKLTNETHRIKLLSQPSLPIDELIISSAKASFSKTEQYDHEDTGKNLRLMSYLIEHGHTTPFQQPQLTYLIEAPLFTIRQLRTYRIAVHNETSYRYTNATDTTFYVPKEFRKQSQNNKQGSNGLIKEQNRAMQLYLESIDDSHNTYTKLIKLGVAKEMARNVLPQSIITGMVSTMSLHGWLHFLDQRLKEDAQYEIRELAKSIYNDIFNLDMPIFIQAVRQLEKIGIKAKW